jgi:hypothetical protein
MNPRQERQALADIRWLRRMLAKLDDRRFLDALAKDEVPAADNQPDPIHVGVEKLCGHVGKAADLIAWAVGTISVLEQLEPTGEREQSVPDCMACGNLALPRPRGGLCKNCSNDFYRRDRSALPDRVAFIHWRKTGEAIEASLNPADSVPSSERIGKP